MQTITIKELRTILLNAIDTRNSEYQRLFHGRGGCYKDFEFLIIDSIDRVLYVSFYESIDTALEDGLIELFKECYNVGEFKALVLQRRYLKQEKSELLLGSIPENNYAIENGLQYELNFLSNQNIGFFADMKEGRFFVRKIAENKKVLNLFSYTCAFSVSAIAGGAKSVVNVDMAKGALTTGRINHHLNSLDTNKVKFMPYNILKSWSRIKKAGPYDVIVIDPPSFQKGSFAATKDYEKIIKRLDELAGHQCTVLACLNAPELTTHFLIDLFKVCAPSFCYVKRLENPETFPSSNDERALKNLVFQRGF